MLEEISINTQSSIRIKGEKTIYFDPIEITEVIHDADVIFITHDHYDHYSAEDVWKVGNSGTILVLPEKMKKQASEQAENFREKPVMVKPGETYEIAGLKVETVHAYNNLKPFHPKRNGWVGYIVTMNGKRYYVAGDTDSNKDNETVRCDVALIPIGGTYTMNAKEAAKFINKIRPGCAVPTHYGSIVGSPEDFDTFKARVDEGILVVEKL